MRAGVVILFVLLVVPVPVGEARADAVDDVFRSFVASEYGVGAPEYAECPLVER